MFILDTSTIFAVVNCIVSPTTCTVKPIRVENKIMKLNRENTLVALPRYMYMYNVHRAFIFIFQALIQNVCLSACDIYYIDHILHVQKTTSKKQPIRNLISPLY